MKARLIITDSTGTVFEGEIELHANAGRSRVQGNRPMLGPNAVLAPLQSQASIDLSLPVRAFMSRYARGAAGPNAFTLLVARLADGEVGREVTVEQIREEWERIAGIIGSFASVYGTRAKNQAWIDSPTRGRFVLLPEWRNAVRKET